MKNILKNKKILTLMIICFLISCVLSFVSCILLSPKIEIEEKHITLSVGDVFQEPEYRAMVKNQDVTSLVKKSGSVNTKKIGTYQLEYVVKYSLFQDKKVLIVDVIDDIVPKIELVGNEETIVCPNKDFVEPGYRAFDNYDGDLTNKVTVEKENNKIIYKVKDSSSNMYVANRKIKYEDLEKPVITLNGASYINIYVNNTYEEPGYNAMDNCDGDISANVSVSGAVNTSVAGRYTIIYKVTDSNQNSTMITRTVDVSERTLIRPSGGGNGKGIIYLTFDDGPNEGTTDVILNILKEEGVSATFFVTCFGPDYLIKRMYDEGHTVALHTASHDYSYVYRSDANYFADLMRVSERVERITGEKSMIVRFPGGSSNTVSKKYSLGIMSRLTAEVRRRGYHYFDWNVDSNDAGGSGSSGIYNNVINNISLNRENVVLLHDVKTATRDTIRSIIRYGKQNGYIFKKITFDTTMVTHGVNN